MTIRTLIVDDEPLARERLRTLLAADPEVAVVGECADGAEAVAALRTLQPDLVFLDVQMPVLDGLQVAQAVGAERMPVTVFVTAYDRYALQAFEAQALDYLLKPYDQERFAAALRRAKTQILRNRTADPAAPPTPSADKPLERLAIRSGGRIYFLRTEEIDWVEAAGNYARLHVGRETHLLRETVGALEGKLDPARFLRIHRSTIVNVERIKELYPGFRGDYVVILKSGTELTLSRTYRPRFQELFGSSF